MVAAIAAGRRAALALDRHLGGRGSCRGQRPAAAGVPGPQPGVVRSPRRRRPSRGAPLGERSLAAEDRATLPWSTLDAEARRCFNCGGCVAVNAADLAPVLVALGATIHTTRRRIPAEEFFAVGAAGDDGAGRRANWCGRSRCRAPPRGPGSAT